jgi:hypothetical protein
MQMAALGTAFVAILKSSFTLKTWHKQQHHPQMQTVIQLYGPWAVRLGGLLASQVVYRVPTLTVRLFRADSWIPRNVVLGFFAPEVSHA